MRCKKKVFDKMKRKYRTCKNRCRNSTYCYKHKITAKIVKNECNLYADFETVYGLDSINLHPIELNNSMETDRTVSINNEIMYEPINKTKNIIVVENESLSESEDEWKVGKCCFCLNECNPCSQSCGKCARILSWYGIEMLEITLGKKII